MGFKDQLDKFDKGFDPVKNIQEKSKLILGALKKDKTEFRKKKKFFARKELKEKKEPKRLYGQDKQYWDKTHYQKGWKDAESARKLFSVVFLKQLQFFMGFRRKSKDNSNFKIFLYCEGFADYIDQL